MNQIAFRRAAAFMVCAWVGGSIAYAPRTCAAEPRPNDRLPQAEFDSVVEQLESADAAARTSAGLKVLNWPGDAFERVKTVVDKQTAGPQALSVLRSEMPLLRLRQEGLNRSREAYEYDLKLALGAYAKTPAPAGSDDAAKKAITIGLKPDELRESGETDRAVVDAAAAAQAKGCHDPLVAWAVARAADHATSGSVHPFACAAAAAATTARSVSPLSRRSSGFSPIVIAFFDASSLPAGAGAFA